ncbi:MAG: Eco57I restriction-modification methylase domain-containing protein [Lachnospiraceae bacterium]
MEKVFSDSFEFKLLYVFAVNDEVHKGLLKIGDATLQTDKGIDELPANSHDLNQAAMARIKQYTNTAGISVRLLHTELAIKTIMKEGVATVNAFRDHDVHRVLSNSGIKKKKLANSTSREWFELDLETALKAIDAVKKNKLNIGNAQMDGYVPIVFRPEQEDVISKTVKQFKTGNRMLWNAKMRFGKTLSALQVIMECKFGKTIIITHRPVVDAGWYEDFGKIFHGMSDSYAYGSKNNGETLERLLRSGKGFVYFASIQDLRGSSQVGGKFDKNDLVFSTEWDFVIVDEAHEGTTTALGDDVIKNIVKDDSNHGTKFLALSGTPFNIMNNYDDNIYTWDYVMEQKAKRDWVEAHFGDSNPYEELPKLNIFTYDLGSVIGNKKYVELEDKAFNFKEFFRTWTGDLRNDRKEIPQGHTVGDFYHEQDVWSFLNLITKTDEKSCYPYSSEEYRNLFKHSLWMLPGVKEARALSAMLKKHPVFGSGAFEIVNVAGDGDKDEESKDALELVRNAIKGAGEDGYTITLSCGKLTTGVTVPEWTAVFMLSGSFSTSAANYLQTIFRVQSPCNIGGKIKSQCYVFDFAPDRTLKMVAEAVTLSTKAGKATESDKRIMGEFLNYCPVISVDGTEMKYYNTNKLLQQLKRAYAERAVKNGFDDANLYNDELLKMDDLDLKQFEQLKRIVGASKASPKAKDIDINNQGFTDEEYEELERIQKKPKKERTPEEKERLKEIAEQKIQKNNAISILRGISIRIPLLIYGADIDFDEDITMDKLVDIVDDSSWDEFMPLGVSKELFKRFIKYYDAEVFVAAGRKIRNTVKSADELPPTERVQKITELFSHFKNPDKETVLTPWRVVNMHMSDCLGGYVFFDTEHQKVLEEPRFVDRGKVTEETLANKNAKILEINSKTGLYPLYVAYSLYRRRVRDISEVDYTVEVENENWKNTVGDNVFVICKTEMAKSITKRTLMGYKIGIVNAHYFEDLINMLENKPKQFTDKVCKASYWKKEGCELKFDAIVGNPPYQIMDGGGKGYSAKPVYNFFIEQAKNIMPCYVSMVTPSRWFAGGKGLDSFRESMLSDTHLAKIVDYADNEILFKGVSIVGGVNYFLWSREYDGECEVTSIRGDDGVTLMRNLSEYDIFIRNNNAIQLIHRVESDAIPKMDTVVYARNVFGISSDYRGTDQKTEKNTLAMFCSQKSNSMGISYISSDAVVKEHELISKYKVIIGKVVPRGGEVGVDPSIGYRVISTIQVLCPDSVFTDSYLLLATFDTEQEAINFAKYMCLKFPRFLLHETYSSMNISKNNFRFVPFLNFEKEWTDKELYEKFNCSDAEIKMIDSIIRPMEYEVNKVE